MHSTMAILQAQSGNPPQTIKSENTILIMMRPIGFYLLILINSLVAVLTKMH